MKRSEAMVDGKRTAKLLLARTSNLSEITNINYDPVDVSHLTASYRGIPWQIYMRPADDTCANLRGYEFWPAPSAPCNEPIMAD